MAGRLRGGKKGRQEKLDLSTKPEKNKEEQGVKKRKIKFMYGIGSRNTREGNSPARANEQDTVFLYLGTRHNTAKT